MKIFLVALMISLNAQGFQPPSAYVFTHMNFNTVEECKEYAVLNSEKVMYKLWTEYGNSYRPHMISCVPETVVEQIMEQGNINDGIAL